VLLRGACSCLTWGVSISKGFQGLVTRYILNARAAIVFLMSMRMQCYAMAACRASHIFAPYTSRVTFAGAAKFHQV
jgi:hypothetical protein